MIIKINKKQLKFLLITLLIILTGLIVLNYKKKFTTISLPKVIEVQPLTVENIKPQLAIVHIAGAVKQPGVYKIAKNKRIIDALKIAGGTTNTASLNSINLAQKIQDGKRYFIPERKKKRTSLSKSVGSSKKINLNTASKTELITIKGIGTKTAALIIAYRNKNGPFQKIEELKKVKGIGTKTLAQLSLWLYIN